MTNLKRGIRNNNPGNIERREGTRWQGMAEDQSSDPRFVVFTKPKWGIRAIARCLITYQDKRRAEDGSDIDSVLEIVERWAPEKDNNNTDAYAQFVGRQLDRAIDDETIDVYDYDTMNGLVKAITAFENGGQPYEQRVIDAGLRLAGIEVPTKPMKQSRTMKASAVAAASTGGSVLVDQLQSAQGMLEPLAQYSSLATYALLGVTLVSVAVVVWARIDDANDEVRA